MNDFFHVNTGLDIKADLTQSAEDITAIAKDTHKGLGKLMYALFGPMIERRIGQAKRFAAQANKDCLDIANELKVFDGSIGTMIPIKEVSSVDALCEELERVNSSCKAKRLAMAIMTAANEIKQASPEKISDEPLNQTFFNHWRSEAELIDEKDLRRIWAHLLVEEIKKPNSISPRTLDIVKNISKQEAEAFLKIIPGIVGDAIIVNDNGYPIWGTYSEILSLQDARLVGASISSVTHSTNHENQQKDKIVLFPFLDNKLVLVFEKDKITFQNFTLTTAGREIYNISKKPLTLEQIKIVAEEISKQNQNTTAIIYPAEILSTSSNGNINYKFFWTPLWTNRSMSSASNGGVK